MPKAIRHAAAARPSAAAPRRRSSTWHMLGLVGLLATLLIVSLPTAMVLVVGLLPTAVAITVDRTSGRYAAWCVGATNVAGTYPFLLEIWTRAHTVAAAQAIVGNVFALLAIYGAAGFGWFLFSAIPPVTAALQRIRSKSVIAELRNVQQRLVDEWGADIRLRGGADGQPPSRAADGFRPAAATPPV